jgi:hypothetical protein
MRYPFEPGRCNRSADIISRIHDIRCQDKNSRMTIM